MRKGIKRYRYRYIHTVKSLLFLCKFVLHSVAPSSIRACQVSLLIQFEEVVIMGLIDLNLYTF